MWGVEVAMVQQGELVCAAVQPVCIDRQLRRIFGTDTLKKYIEQFRIVLRTGARLPTYACVSFFPWCVATPLCSDLEGVEKIEVLVLVLVSLPDNFSAHQQRKLAGFQSSFF